MAQKTLKIGTRNSPLAMVQARMVETALKKAHPDLLVEIIPIQSAADWKKNDPEKALDTQKGGKGQFAKEIEVLLLQGEVDCGVHSLKDMDSNLPEGLAIDHYLPRANPRDAFISQKWDAVEKLPEGATLGTCSPRRAAFTLMKRPDLKIAPFRGNVQTRLEKVRGGQVDATYLAMAGLERLSIEDAMIHEVSEDDMMPACGQGVVCIERRKDDSETAKLLDTIHHTETGICAEAERSILRALDGNCHTPIGAYATYQNGVLNLKAIIASQDGAQFFNQEIAEPCQTSMQASELGYALGLALKSKAPEGFLDP